MKASVIVALGVVAVVLVACRAEDAHAEDAHADAEADEYAGDQYDDEGAPDMDEMFYRMGRIHTLVNFDVNDRKKDHKVGTEEDNYNLWRRFDAHHPYKEDVFQEKKAEEENAFKKSATKAVIEEKAKLSDVFYGSLAHLVEKLDKENPDVKLPELNEKQEELFKEMLNMVTTIEEMVQESLDENKDAKPDDETLEEDISSKVESLLYVAAYGTSEDQDDVDAYDDETMDWDSNAGTDWDKA
eukprot:CAMPEP_0198727562 /NCGR_PEP_ID=MMETSP1475-20131203/4497_1 /TAXON_ID= ORGANISM="Unidentified sp., Strain CCMP1999" /NCGR_SAMPLE_ID=MMETSP1475 /ASSEMBLY_ACC=CAM_ASM_001111 /LENGTH=241 /DNA_ID=CAMNT_0044489615 /DNA_START=80 /DNA_END=805 /DNA_ORIENTATION=-